MRGLKGAAVGAVLAAASWPAGVDLRAFSVTGHRWATATVSYFVNPQNQYMTAADAIAAIQQAADTWNTQSNANVSLVYAGTTQGSSLGLNYKNEVFFRDEASTNTAATYWWYDGSGRLIDADIVFYQQHWNTHQTGCTDGYYIENTGAHEFGHVLGLNHSEFETATMWGSTSGCMTSKETLEPDDIAGLASIYPPVGPSTSAPSAPAQLLVNSNPANPSGSLALGWGNSGNANGFRVERRIGSSGSFVQIAQVAGATAYFTDFGLAANTDYSYRVSAFNGAGTSPYSNVASGVTQPAPASVPSAPTAPAVPSGPAPASSAVNVNTTVALSWISSGATSYDVYFGSVLYRANLTTAALLVDQLDFSTKYSWRVVAKNAAGSTSGPNWTFTTKKRTGKK